MRIEKLDICEEFNTKETLIIRFKKDEIHYFGTREIQNKWSSRTFEGVCSWQDSCTYDSLLHTFTYGLTNCLHHLAMLYQPFILQIAFVCHTDWNILHSDIDLIERAFACCPCGSWVQLFPLSKKELRNSALRACLDNWLFQWYTRLYSKSFQSLLRNLSAFMLLFDHPSSKCWPHTGQTVGWPGKKRTFCVFNLEGFRQRNLHVKKNIVKKYLYMKKWTHIKWETKREQFINGWKSTYIR